MAKTEKDSDSDVQMTYIDGHINVDMPSVTEVQLTLTDIVGNKLRSTTLSNTNSTVNISDLTSGIYILYITSVNGNLELSQIIQHSN